MGALTIDALALLASAAGLELSDQELAALLPLVAAARETTDALVEALTPEIEPAAQYRIL